MATKKDDKKTKKEDGRKDNGKNRWTREQEIEQIVAELENEARPILKVNEQEFGRRDSGEQKSVLTMEQKMLEDRLLYWIYLGHTLKDAAAKIGRDRATILRWRQDPNNATFATMFTLAKRKSKERAITAVQNAIIKGNLDAAKWWLEKRGGKEFKDIKKTQLDVNINQKISVTERKSIADRFKGLLIDEPSTIQTPSQEASRAVN